MTDRDLLLIAKLWKRLSPEFRAIYQSSLSIPSGFKFYNSPGGQFEVYYTTTGNDAVDPADTYRFSANSWRTRENTANGVPDYVDEVAWALDSAWSLEITRFGFSPPHPFVDYSHSSDKFKVVIIDVTDGMYELYGLTWPAGKVSGETGIRSYIEIRNDWSAPEWGVYQVRPLDAAHITCAHEFFHGIQYGMAHEENPSVIDYLPIAWLEATAVLMEELAFDHVNDYVQYSAGYDGYFGNPRLTVLSDGYFGTVDPYANGVVAMYFYRHAIDTPAISFVKTVFKLNEQERKPFLTLLDAASDSSGTTWATLLNRFHTASFYSGERADTSAFLRDAALLPQWSYPEDTIDAKGAVTKDVRAFSMQTFSHQRSEPYGDTLFISFVPEAGRWAARVLLLDSTSSQVYQLPLDANSTGQIAVTDWDRWDEAVVVATNAVDTLTRSATVFFTDFHIEDLYISNSFDAYPNPVMRQSHGVLKIRGKTVVEVVLYSVDGKVVARAHVHTGGGGQALVPTENGFDWLLCNRDGEQVVPGTYMIVATYQDTRTNTLNLQRKRVLVLP